MIIDIPLPTKFSIGVKSSARNSNAKDFVFMSICMGEETALLGVKDIGALVGTVEEDANPEALGIGAEKEVDCIGYLCCMKGFHPRKDRSTPVSWE